ncbi:helix-turn-helix domain-containing protein [Bradyrhizobium sp. LHD-71]|uniref:IclR family transcriptional regulator domain-containing protein n=1 Tax=Bradyrhizobium sp. LHD-71 TaxID=3072141 RepID=UPI00280D1DC7|nr:helix-turn-helix domain-containing protein [Bradyrhizobium sp. LHD-71]MDQ8726701.1 helix-turn-helix domain-containing protein [Bradyrhizobium sp. LHD-71]
MPLAAPSAIEPVERAFRVLEALNRHRTSTLTALAAATALPKSTTARLLETLVALGYVTHVSRSMGYRITDRVLTLAAGVRFVDNLVNAAAGPMSEFTASTGWPLYLGTVSDALVLIRHSTAPESPMSFETVGYDLKFRIYESALGLAYLSFCAADERRSIIDAIGTDGGRFSIAQRTALERHLALVRERGYAFTRSARSRRVNGMAVPIVRGQQVLGALTLRYPKRVMTEDQVAARFAAQLTTTARDIAARAFERRWPEQVRGPGARRERSRKNRH